MKSMNMKRYLGIVFLFALAAALLSAAPRPAAAASDDIHTLNVVLLDIEKGEKDQGDTLLLFANGQEMAVPLSKNCVFLAEKNRVSLDQFASRFKGQSIRIDFVDEKGRDVIVECAWEEMVAN
jgi:hypothetical protein